MKNIVFDAVEETCDGSKVLVCERQKRMNPRTKEYTDTNEEGSGYGPDIKRNVREAHATTMVPIN